VATKPHVDIFEYLDYREYLRDAYGDLKARQQGFSYRAFSKRAGMSSPNFLKLVIDGQRNLTPSSVERFAEALALGPRETAFFRELVGFNQAASPAQKNEHYERIGKFRKHRAVRRLERDTFAYLSHWYYPAIRELVTCSAFREDPEWISAQLRPHVPPARVREAIEVLLEVGVLERDEHGELKQGEPLLSTGPEVRSLAVGNFHRQMMERAADSIELIDREEREISGVTVALSPERFEMFKNKIHALRAELLELSAAETDPSRVVQFNFQAFPLALIEEEPS
jgi:uncharacterized protein (TIGR02147 family)